MEKKAKVRLTNEEMTKKFKSNFDLVNYAIRLAENMIKTGRDTRVRSDVQNRAMLIIEEISEGKDQFDDVTVNLANGSELDFDHIPQAVVYEESPEKRKYRTNEAFEKE